MVSSSNVGRVCPECFLGTNSTIHSCGTETVVIDLGARINLPKHNNKRAWKRILSGEYAWNRRKSRGKRGKDTLVRYEYERVPIDDERTCDCVCCNMYSRSKFILVAIEGSGTEYENPHQKPSVDLGG